ncbi:bifunctional nicotinamide-nucleotide adenylyltransferase/Nudix hydroxylase [Massilia glaciei]|uniref:NUDIX domain-containing protein n=1 Tax=Massilia glaciei TaxID=1524097 RepID=A0A2U2I5I8_9BURK|nr:bifunctional nicotinamide-nucleotide adenylyltransferase/Nudix hydroxylase [Massilia glaciei]PWF55024.1 NUDIX domain-containing protein [Massilia glaciei]
MINDARADVAVLIGRFQPFHNGHAALLKAALASAPHVVVVLGSSFRSRSAKNPFTWEERAAMIDGSLAAEERTRVSYLAARDYYNDPRWAAEVRAGVKRMAPAAQKIALVAFFKDVSSYYLNNFPEWEPLSVKVEAEIDATRIRRVLFEAEDLDVSLSVIAPLVPTAVRQYLKAWTFLPYFAPLAEEHKAVEAYKASWRAAPYPPIFSTVDAVVKTAGYVLLIRRNDFPGKGLWAMPGGFVEPGERLLQAAMRELNEETELGVLMPTLADALIGVAVFDHPNRSQRGRTITHAHFFDLKTEHLPEIEGADDAALAKWVPIDQLLSMEEQFFEDHFHILDHFLQLTGDV